METTGTPTPRINFYFYAFVGEEGHRTTRVVRDCTQADGMRTLVNGNAQSIRLAAQKVSEWSASNGITVRANDPYPSTKHPGNVWLDFRFGGLSL